MIPIKSNLDANSNLLQRKNAAIQEYREKYDKIVAMTSSIKQNNDGLMQ